MHEVQQQIDKLRGKAALSTSYCILFGAAFWVSVMFYFLPALHTHNTRLHLICTLVDLTYISPNQVQLQWNATVEGVNLTMTSVAVANGQARGSNNPVLLLRWSKF